jgi:hypothetical protein
LHRRIAVEETFNQQVQALGLQRNQCRASFNWRFSEDARINLHHLYPANN